MRAALTISKAPYYDLLAHYHVSLMLWNELRRTQAPWSPELVAVEQDLHQIERSLGAYEPYFAVSGHPPQKDNVPG